MIYFDLIDPYLQISACDEILDETERKVWFDDPEIVALTILSSTYFCDDVDHRHYTGSANQLFDMDKRDLKRMKNDQLNVIVENVFEYLSKFIFRKKIFSTTIKGRRETDPISAIKQKRAKKLNLLFHLSKNIAYKAQPIAAPNTHKSPDVNLRLKSKEILPFIIIKNTPSKHIANPQI